MVCYELHNPPEPQREAGIQPTSHVSFEVSISMDLCKILISSWRSSLRQIFQSELEADIDSNVSHFLQKDYLKGLQSYPERLQSEQPSSEPQRALVGPSYGCTVKHRLLTRISTRCGSEYITRLQANDSERHTVNCHLLSDPKGRLYTTKHLLPDFKMCYAAEYKDLPSVSSAWLPTARATLNITLLSVLLLALIPSYKLLLKPQDTPYLLPLLLVAWLPASLLHVVRRKVKANSSKTISIITVTLSCYVKMTDSAPLHLPNLLTRGTVGGNGTYTVPLQGSPNTGYCAKITIGLTPYPQEVYILSTV